MASILSASETQCRNTRIDSGSAAQAGSSPRASALASREYDTAPTICNRRLAALAADKVSARKRSRPFNASAARVRRRVDVLVVANVVEERGDLDDARVVAAELSVDRERERADPFRVRQAVALAARLEFRPRERQRPRARVRRGGVGGRRRQIFEQRGRGGV